MDLRWRATKQTVMALGLLVLGLGLTRLSAGDDPSVSRMKRDITFLASPECEGRGPGTKGIDKAADYIVEQFKKAGLNIYEPDVAAFRTFAREKYGGSELSKTWAPGIIEKVEAL